MYSNISMSASYSLVSCYLAGVVFPCSVVIAASCRDSTVLLMCVKDTKYVVTRALLCNQLVLLRARDLHVSLT